MRPIRTDGYPIAMHPIHYPTLPPRRGAVQLVGLCILSIFRALARHRKAQRDYARLLNMPDHLLRDVGLTRDDVVRAKAKPLIRDDLEAEIR